MLHIDDQKTQASGWYTRQQHNKRWGKDEHNYEKSMKLKEQIRIFMRS